MRRIETIVVYKRRVDAEMRTVAIIQARIGASRLPGKVLMPLCGKPMLWHVLMRLRCCRQLDDIIIATSTSTGDAEIVEFAKQHKVKIFRGSETDVLGRYIKAAEEAKADYVMRVTADSPLIEPGEIDSVIEFAITENAGFVMMKPGTSCVHEGFDMVHLDSLKKSYKAVDIEDFHKEHVIIYLKEHQDFVKTVYFEPLRIFQKEGYKISVDTIADFEFMHAMYEKFWDGRGIVDLKEVVKFVDSNPNLKVH